MKDLLGDRMKLFINDYYMSGFNQTDTYSPVLSNALLNFTINIETNLVQIPGGLQAYSLGVHRYKWLLIDTSGC